MSPWSTGFAVGRGMVIAVAVESMRSSRYEALPGGGGRERLTSEAITEAIRPCTPQGAFGARHWHTRATSARHRIRHGLRHTAALAGRRPRPSVANDRLRHMLIGDTRVSKADGSQSLELQRDALQAAGVDAATSTTTSRPAQALAQ